MPCQHNFIPGHFYLNKSRYEGSFDSQLLRFVKRGMGRNGPKKYVFELLAWDGVSNAYPELLRFPKEEGSMLSRMTEVRPDELPLYIAYEHKHPAFEKAIKEACS